MCSPHVQIVDCSHCIWQTPRCGSALSGCSSPAAVWRKVLQAHKIESRLAFGPFLCSKKKVPKTRTRSPPSLHSLSPPLPNTKASGQLFVIDIPSTLQNEKCSKLAEQEWTCFIIFCCSAVISAMQTANETLATAKACRPIAQLMETRQPGSGRSTWSRNPGLQQKT